MRLFDVLTSGSHMFLWLPQRCRQCGWPTLWCEAEMGVPAHPGGCTERMRSDFERYHITDIDDDDDEDAYENPRT